MGPSLHYGLAFGKGNGMNKRLVPWPGSLLPSPQAKDAGVLSSNNAPFVDSAQPGFYLAWTTLSWWMATAYGAHFICRQNLEAPLHGSILMIVSLPHAELRRRGKRGWAGIYEPPPNLVVSKNKFSFSLRAWHILNFCSLLNMNSPQRFETQAGFFLCF